MKENQSTKNLTLFSGKLKMESGKLNLTPSCPADTLPTGEGRVGVSKNLAFTLAEVLITLGVIGVVAALTLSSVITKYQKKQTLTKLKKAYTTLSQAIKLSEIDNDSVLTWEDEGDAPKYIKKYYLPYLKGAKLCSSHTDCGYNDNRYSYKSPNGNSFYIELYTKGLRAPIMTSDGMIYIIAIAAGNDYKKSNSVYVDINGSKLPNQICRDFFVFAINDNGLLIPSEKTAPYVGYNCAKLIMENSWKFPDDYPW